MIKSGSQAQRFCGDHLLHHRLFRAALPRRSLVSEPPVERYHGEPNMLAMFP